MKKYILILTVLIFFAFTTDNNKSTYSIPILAYSVTAGDIDLDGDNDIVVGHRIHWELDSPVITILDNYENGLFRLTDTIKDFYAYQENIILAKVNNYEYLDLILLKIEAVMFYSFYATCKKNNINPYQWLKKVLDVIPNHEVNKLHELLP